MRIKIIERDNEIEISGAVDFDLEKTFECGQCFRWNVDENGVYKGITQGIAAGVRKAGDSVFISGTMNDFDNIWRFYFDLDRDYEKIRHQLCIDDFMKKAVSYGTGIRLLRQDKWEALCSFIISQNNNIPRIKSIIDTLCIEFGNLIGFKGEEFYSFPSPAVLANKKTADLAPLRCGYRAEYIINAARAVSGGQIDLNALTSSTIDSARTELKKLRGVGDKVADCVLLYGLHMLDAFPRDVWMKRAVASYYGPDFDPGIFSPYAGIAQQYIFHYIRNG